MVTTGNWPPLTRWTPARGAGFVARAAVVLALAYVLVRVPEVGLAGLLGATAPYWLAKLGLDVLVLGYVAVRSRWSGIRLVAALALVYAGLQVVSFVELQLYGLLTPPETVAGAGWSLLHGTLVALLVAVGFGRAIGETVPATDDRLRLPLREWAWKLPLLGSLFVVLMVLAGLVVFEGLARVVDPVARAGYELLEPPAWILPFQLVRGLVFTSLLLPVVRLFGGGHRETGVSVALLFAVLLASNMIAGHDTVPGLLWVAHFFELFAQAFVYGLVAVALLVRSHHPVRWLRRRLSRASPEGALTLPRR